jgi:hypothetical protein
LASTRHDGYEETGNGLTGYRRGGELGAVCGIKTPVCAENGWYANILRISQRRKIHGSSGRYLFQKDREKMKIAEIIRFSVAKSLQKPFWDAFSI